jgi:two-component system phosphate regulon response regulator PhoB
VDRESTASASALVIEDNEHTSYLLSFMLERAGFRVDAIDNGRDAEKWIESEPAALVVLLDLMLPHVDGFQLLMQMRETAEWKDVPVIVVSARTAESDVVRALDLGADDYVTKPFRPLELLARIRRLTRAFPGKVGA